MRNDFSRLIPISVIALIAICIVLLRTMILDLNEFFGYRDIVIFMVVQFVLTFNISCTIYYRPLEGKMSVKLKKNLT